MCKIRIKYIVLVFCSIVVLESCSQALRDQFVKNILIGNRLILETSHPMFSANGEKILFSPRVNDKARIVLYDLKSNKAVCIKPPLPETYGFFHPVFSYDYKKIFFCCFDKKSNRIQICTINIDGSGFTQLTHSDFDHTDLFYSPKKNILGFLRSAPVEIPCIFWKVCIYDFEKNEEKMIYERTNKSIIHNPTFSDDGDKIFFSEEYPLHSTNNLGEIYSEGFDFNLVGLDIKTRNCSDLIIEKRVLTPAYLPNTDKILYLGSDYSIRIIYHLTKDTIPEKRGMYSYSLKDGKISFLSKEAESDYYYLSVSYDGKKALFINIDDFYEYDIIENKVTKLNIDRAEILRAVEEKDKKK